MSNNTINKSDSIYFDSCYKISVHNYDNETFQVYANCEQNALDILVDWMEENDYNFYLWSLEDIEREGFTEEEFIVAGNHCHYLDAEHTWIEEIK